MLVRSQDKTVCVDNNGVDIYIIENEIRAKRIDTRYVVLGKYNSEERAIEVLDDICSAYEISEYTNNYYNGYGEVPYTIKNNAVFQMPLKED